MKREGNHPSRKINAWKRKISALNQLISDTISSDKSVQLFKADHAAAVFLMTAKALYTLSAFNSFIENFQI